MLGTLNSMGRNGNLPFICEGHMWVSKHCIEIDLSTLPKLFSTKNIPKALVYLGSILSGNCQLQILEWSCVKCISLLRKPLLFFGSLSYTLLNHVIIIFSEYLVRDNRLNFRSYCIFSFQLYWTVPYKWPTWKTEVQEMVEMIGNHYSIIQTSVFCWVMIPKKPGNPHPIPLT